MNVTHDQSYGLFHSTVAVGTKFAAKSMDAEFSPARREIGGRDLMNCVCAHKPIISRTIAANVKRMYSCDPVALTAGAKVKDSVLLGCDGDAVARRGMEAPAIERGQGFLVKLRPHALKDRFIDDFAALIDRDFNHHVAFRIGQLPGICNGIGGLDRKRGANLLSVGRAGGECSVRKSGWSAVAQRGKRLRFRFVFGFGWRERNSRRKRRSGGCLPR